MVGFALARDYNDARIAGTATGVVNVGGFVATVIVALGVGRVLDLAGAGPEAFRPAMLSLVVVQAVGVVQVLRWWRRTRAYLLVRMANGDTVPVPVVRRFLDYPIA